MKKLFAIILFAISCQQLQAQNALIYDKEKLLEYYQSQRYADAAVYLQSIYPQDTQDVKALSQIAYCFMMAGKLPEAEKAYLKIIDQQPNSLPVLFSLANINVRRGNDLKARSYYQSIVKLDSLNFNAYKQLAGLYIKDTDSQKVEYLFKANKINPIEADVALDLALSYRKLENHERAYKVLTKAIEADTGHLVLQEAKLPIAIKLKKYKEVILTGEKLLTKGADENVVKDVGLAHFYLKDYEKAISYFKMLEEMGAQKESSLYYTSLSYRSLSNYNLAAEYAKKTIKEGISQNTTSYYLLLGGIYEVNKQFLSAATAYKRGLTFGENGNLYYRLGILSEFNLKQPKSAINYYKLYLKSKPDVVTDKEQIEYSKDRIASLSGSKIVNPTVASPNIIK